MWNNCTGLNAVDRDVIGLQVGVELSYLTVPEQEMVEEVHESTGKYPSLEQAKKIRQHREEKTLTKVLQEEREDKKHEYDCFNG